MGAVSGFVIWDTDRPYICGAGLDGDIYDTRDTAEDCRWVTGRDTDKHQVLKYVECEMAEYLKQFRGDDDV